MNTHNAVTLVIYIVVNFAVAALWHLALFADLLASSTPFAREAPIFALGLAAMVVQGSLLITIYPKFHHAGARVLSGLKFGGGAGLFLAVGAIWVDVAKFNFTNPTVYLVVESVYEVMSFAILGVVIALRHPEPASNKSQA